MVFNEFFMNFLFTLWLLVLYAFHLSIQSPLMTSQHFFLFYICFGNDKCKTVSAAVVKYLIIQVVPLSANSICLTI